jgi:peptidoglycan/xylan/chitin deacetylase (PgdA/CDA1 family)
MRGYRTALLGAALFVLGAAPAAAAPDLTLTASHARPVFLRAQAPNTTLYAGTLVLSVGNAGPDPTDGSTVTVTETLPAGLSALVNQPGLGAGPTAASGPGWTCAGTTTTRCTRSDVLAPGASYEPITMTVSVANSAAATLRTAPSVAGGGDAAGATVTDDIPVAVDACPNGWPASAANPEGADGCTPLDREDGCTARIGLTFDDGPSVYRPETLAHLRAKGVPATFFDVGMRMEANPQLTRFELREGHVVLGHTWDHPNLNNIPASVLAFETTETAARFAANGAPYTFDVIRPPFLSVNPSTAAALAALGFAVTPNPIAATDWDPSRSAEQIRDAIVGALRPGVAILLHDGPVDSPAGRATVDSVPLIIDAARARGYCFGTVDRTGQVVANRLAPSTEPIPVITNPVPYLPLAYPGPAPAPAVTVPQPLRITASHAPEVFLRGGTGSLTLTVSNPTTTPTDGSTTTVTQVLPAGLTATSAGGSGWTCSGTATITCTRADVLAPGGAFPPITIGVQVAPDAAAVITTAPRVTGRSGNVWIDTGADSISTAAPVPRDIVGTVPATLALTLGAPATFGAFTPGVTRVYTASTTANVVSTAGDATLSFSEPGHLTNGAFTLPQPLQVALSKAAWTAPVSNDPVTVTFTQRVEATDALRTGAYRRTLLFTLSTTTP